MRGAPGADVMSPMLRRLLPLLVLAAVLVVPDAALAARCGNKVGGPAYYDLRAQRESCATARKVARSWARKRVNVFARVRVAGHSCRGGWSSKRIRGAQSFKVTCRRGRRLAYWFIRPN
jgi:hypothetical protein